MNDSIVMCYLIYHCWDVFIDYHKGYNNETYTKHRRNTTKCSK
jgi:hypothetical protein